MTDDGTVCWWSVPPHYRLFMMVVIYPILAVGIVFFAGSIWMLVAPVQKDWGQILGSTCYVVFAWLAARNWLVGLAISDDALLVCPLLPGRAERIPLDHIRWCRTRAFWLRRVVILKASRIVPLWLQNEPHPVAGGWLIPGWEGLVVALREKLEPLGKWRG
jgi:hypothetical protein